MAIGNGKHWRLWRNIGGHMGKENKRLEELQERLRQRTQARQRVTPVGRQEGQPVTSGSAGSGTVGCSSSAGVERFKEFK